MTHAVIPGSLDEALEALAREPDLVPLAGCTDWMVGRTELAPVAGVLDLLGLGELGGIRETPQGLEIGATATFHDIGGSPLVARLAPALAAAARAVGGWQIQNRATLGGNIVNASPAGDSLPVLLALEASFELASTRGRRLVACREFFTGYRRTALGPGELLVAVRIPAAPGAVQRFRKVGTRQAQAISKVVVCLMGRVAEGRVELYRLAAGSVGPVPARLTAVEEAVTGRPWRPELAALAGRVASESVEPIDDVRSTARYRREVLGRVVRRLTLELTETA